MPGKLTYSALCSLDGYIEDADGGFGWAAPDAEVHAFINERERAVGTMLLGRRMHETLAVWETMATAGEPPEIADYRRIWLGAEKVVYSRTLAEPTTTRTRIEREFEPAAVRALKAAAADGGRDLSIGGAELAGAALRAVLVDEVSLFLAPVVVGGGKRALPTGLRLNLELEEEQRFAAGVAFLRYGIDV